MPKFDYGKMKMGKDQDTVAINNVLTKQTQTKALVDELAPNSKSMNIKIDKLVRYERNRSNDDEEIDDLVDSYERLGFISVLTVRRIKGKDKYEIISGHRRWRALMEILKKQPNFLPKREVPCIVLPEDTDEKLVREMNIRMNIDNVRLNPKEYREQINELIDLRKNEKGELTADAVRYITSKLGIKRITVYRYSRLNEKLIPELGELMDKGYINQNQADQFTQLNKSTQYLFYNDLYKQIEEGNFKPTIDKKLFEEALNQDKLSQTKEKELDKQISSTEKTIAEKQERMKDDTLSDYKMDKLQQQVNHLIEENNKLREAKRLSEKREAESARLNRETKKTINMAMKTLTEDTEISDTEKAIALVYSDKLTKLNQALNNMGTVIYRDRTRLNTEQLSKLKEALKELTRLVEYCEEK